MKDFKQEVYFNVEDIPGSKEKWINKTHISPKLKAELYKADVIFAPLENLREGLLPVFPSGTIDLFKKVKKELPDLKVDVCSEEEDYQEIALHSNILRLGKIVVELVIAPLFVNWLSSFIQRNSEKKDPLVQVNLIVVNDNSAKSYDYFDKKSKLDDSIVKEIENYCYSSDGSFKKRSSAGGYIDERV